jgi:hypothetical protein
MSSVICWGVTKPAHGGRSMRRAPLQGYCVKCRQKREMKDVHAITMKNGRPANEGKCEVCGTKIFVIGKGS